MAKSTKVNKVENFNIFDTDSAASSSELFAIKEAYKTIRTNLILSLDEKPCHIIAVTSSTSGEGKSTSSINLAITISQLNKKVLMIDGDLRKRRASEYLDYEQAAGLTDVILEKSTLEDAVIETKYSNFDFLSSGTTVNNPAEILASKAMAKLLEKLSERYEFIIIDTPPVNLVSDALPIIKISDGVVLVARELVITGKDFGKLLSSIELIDAKILGLIYIGTDSTLPYYHKKGYYGHKFYSKYDKYSGYDN